MSEMETSWMALDRLEQAAECLRVLAHPHRLRMVEMLLKDLSLDCPMGCQSLPGQRDAGRRL